VDGVTCDFEFGAPPPTAIRFVLRTDCNADDGEAPPFRSLACVAHLSSASSTVFLSPDSELFQYQMLENPDYPFFRNFEPERARIVPKGRRFRGDDDADNCLALYGIPMHQMFEGIQTKAKMPLIMLTPGHVGARDALTKRTSVEVVIRCKTRDVYDSLSPLMKVGSRCDDATLRITATVHVLNPSAFASNLRIRAKITRKQWGEPERATDDDTSCGASAAASP
jgi:hypothetical protein